MYCEMPKVGSTNWKRVFMKLTNPKYENIPIEGEMLHNSLMVTSMLVTNVGDKMCWLICLCHQHKPSPTSVTNIDAAVLLVTVCSRDDN